MFASSRFYLHLVILRNSRVTDIIFYDVFNLKIKMYIKSLKILIQRSSSNQIDVFLISFFN